MPPPLLIFETWSSDRAPTEATPPSAVVPPPAADLDDLDAVLDAALAPGGAAQTVDGAEHHAADAAATRELFASIASNHVRPVKNFIHELRRGTAARDWIEICQPIMTSIVDSAESLGLDREARAMREFGDALALAEAESDDGSLLDGECRELLLACYEELFDVLPETFELGEDDRRREIVIIHSLLRQIPQLGAVTLERLYAAGVTTLEALYAAEPRELADATGIPGWMCERICEKVRSHREEPRRGGLAEPDQPARLAELVAELKRHHELFHRISEKHDPDLAPKKRESLRNRQACALQINVVLAELGQVDLVEELKKLAVERRIEKLETHLAATRTAGSIH